MNEESEIEEKKIVAGTRTPISLAKDFNAEARNVPDGIKKAEEASKIGQGRIDGKPLDTLVDKKRIVGSYVENSEYQMKDGLRIVNEETENDKINPEQVSDKGFFDGPSLDDNL